MTSTNDRPYTEADLRTEAAKQHKTATEDLDFSGIGEQMDGTEPWTNLGDDDFDAAMRAIDDLLGKAADVSEWAVDLGADGLEPDGEVIDIAHGDVIGVRIHFAFHPDMPAELRASVIAAVHEETAASAESPAR